MRGSCIKCPDPPPPVRLAIGLVILAFNLLVMLGPPVLIGMVMDIVGDLQMFRGIGMMVASSNEEIQAFYEQLALITLDFSYERAQALSDRSSTCVVCFPFGSLLMRRIDVGRTRCGQPGCNGVTSDFASVTLLNYMLLGITLVPFTIFLGSQMFFFGLVHEGRVTLNPLSTEPVPKGILDLRGELPLLAKLLSRFRACLPSMRQKISCKHYRKTQAR